MRTCIHDVRTVFGLQATEFAEDQRGVLAAITERLEADDHAFRLGGKGFSVCALGVCLCFLRGFL